MARKRKTADEYRVWGHYGHGWEEVTAESTGADARARLREYRENDPRHTYKMTGPHRVPLEAAD